MAEYFNFHNEISIIVQLQLKLVINLRISYSKSAQGKESGCILLF